MTNNYGYGDALAYNVLAGALPECLQMDTIKQVLSEKLRKLPTESPIFMKKMQNSASIKTEKTPEKSRPKLVWSLRKRKKYFTGEKIMAKRAASFVFFSLASLNRA